MSKTLKFGVIGAGYMGKAYAIALNTVASVYSLSAKPVLELIATSSADGAARKADAFGFKRATGSWQALVADADPEVEGAGVGDHGEVGRVRGRGDLATLDGDVVAAGVGPGVDVEEGHGVVGEP